MYRRWVLYFLLKLRALLCSAYLAVSVSNLVEAELLVTLQGVVVMSSSLLGPIPPLLFLEVERDKRYQGVRRRERGNKMERGVGGSPLVWSDTSSHLACVRISSRQLVKSGCGCIWLR